MGGEDAQEIIRRKGVETCALYRTTGVYGFVLILDTQDERAMAWTPVEFVRLGAIGTETLFASRIPSPVKEQRHA